MNLKDIDINDDKSLIAFGDNFFDESAAAKRKLERQWLLNILFIGGDQLCKVNSRTNEIVRINVEDDPDWYVRVVNNRTMPVYRTMVAKLTKNKPLPMCTANSREDKDVQAARASVKLLENHWINLGMDEGHQEIAGWLVATGNCFVKQFYNPKKGDVIVIDEKVKKKVDEKIDKEIEDDDKGKKIKGNISKKTEVCIGDTDLVIRNPFNCYPQRGKSKLDKMTMFGDCEFITVDEAYDKYDIEVEPGRSNRDKQLYISNATIGDIINTGELNQDVMSSDLVMVRELYILPNRKFKNGIQYKWIGDQVVEVIEECTEIPFTHLGLIKIPGKFWYEAIITDVVPMQIRWNELLSKIEMHNDLYNDPPIIIDPNVINIDDFTNEPGLILERKSPGIGAEEPWVMKVPQLDQAILQEVNILDKQFEIVPVLNKVSFGKDTPNARSGLAINYLQEKDDDVIRPLIAEIETSYTKIFKRDFKLCQENYSEDRGFAIVGKDNKVEWINFMKSYLDANVDVRVEPGSAMPRSISAQQAMILELMDRGFFVDSRTGQMDYGKIAGYLEFGGINEMYEDITLDGDHAKRVIEELVKGNPVIVQEWFNFNAHLYEVNRFRKTTSYDDLSDFNKFLVDNYANQCLTMLSPKAPTGGGRGLSAGITGPVGVAGGPAVPPSAGPASPIQMPMQMSQVPSTPSTPTSSSEIGSPLSDKEISMMLTAIKKLKPDLWNAIKKADPDEVTATLMATQNALMPLTTNP